MNFLFTKNSLTILESLTFTKALYAFDFDGTLSKIVRVPADASISKNTQILLQKLSKLVTVAIISGRSIEDLKKRINIKIPYLIGNHGIEGLGISQKSLNQAKIDNDQWIKHLSKKTFPSGIEIENKIYSMAIHYRRSRNKKEARKSIQRAIENLKPTPRIITGKYVFNILPKGAPHKGVALLELMKKIGMKQAFYIGDDDTDEDVFSLPNTNIMTVRVGEKRISNARYFINRQTEINRLLKLLIQYHSLYE